ncbi:septal ring lytic transglycosylase RlpA family protein [Chlorobaculum sp. 24CR]|uniref:septal ring lytic transglycosylase RlpA family protein n=1 Tax=Chlorobaculum sp. 24CR TaxID=2508878 RepID=UPI00100B77B8|nr:septal ring lytic transglycosylase RlpA family protein [Chlorobaculum sp. 24CR]RXK82261.1 septal ring lytic transglycosylase RlpA family protein [Chlorobaculum sp. 24CR]
MKKPFTQYCRLALALSLIISASPFSALASQNGAINHTISQKSSSSRSTAKPRPNGDRFMVAVGRASFYASRFHGRTTANGETFDMKEFTAAHRSLPFGTIVRVTNLNNGKMVFVKINDRGPYVKNRIIDLSKAAAKQLDLVDSGVGRVKIEAYN